MSETSVTILCAVIGSGLITTIITRIFKVIDDKKQKKTGLSAGIQWLLQDKLEFLMSRAIVEGNTTVQEKTFIDRGFNLYCMLGTEDGIKTLKEEYDELSVLLDLEQLRNANLANRNNRKKENKNAD